MGCNIITRFGHFSSLKASIIPWKFWRTGEGTRYWVISKCLLLDLSNCRPAPAMSGGQSREPSTKINIIILYLAFTIIPNPFWLPWVGTGPGQGTRYWVISDWLSLELSNHRPAPTMSGGQSREPSTKTNIIILYLVFTIIHNPFWLPWVDTWPGQGVRYWVISDCLSLVLSNRRLVPAMSGLAE